MQQTKRIVFSVIGWYGMTAVLVAYGLVTLAVLPSQHIICILLNLTGSLSLVVSAYSKRADQLMVLNIIWAVVALIALFQLVTMH